MSIRSLDNKKIKIQFKPHLNFLRSKIVYNIVSFFHCLYIYFLHAISAAQNVTMLYSDSL